MPTISFIVILLTTGTGCITDVDSSSPMYEITWAGTPPAESETIERMIAQEASPYSDAVYGNVTISALGDNGRLRIHVVAVSSDSQYPDLYDFTYRDGELILVGYLLEAIPEPVRSEAIGIVIQSEYIADAYGTPSVKRILPETAAKFYAPRTLLSVTWMDSSASALVDMDKRQVVEVWSGN